MPGRHQAAARRRLRLRWLAGIAGGAVVGATLLATFASAGAATDPVKATFGVTGVATDGCPVSTGGTDVYVKPGQDLDVHSSLAGITLLGIPLDFSNIASLDGSLTIDTKSFPITGQWKTVSWGTSGTHTWHWKVDRITLLNALHIPVTFNQAGLIALGIQPSSSGTIHVTSDRTKCGGLAAQLPSVSASISVTGLPPIQVGVPGVKITVPVTIPTSIPSLPGLGGKKSTAPAAGHTSAGAQIDNPIPVPARVVPGGDVAAGGGGGYNALPLPNIGSSDQGNPGSLLGAAHSAAASAEPDQNSTGKHKTIDLAASPSSSTGEVWVVLAIVAVIALAFVAATYARLYLIKRSD